MKDRTEISCQQCLLPLSPTASRHPRAQPHCYHVANSLRPLKRPSRSGVRSDVFRPRTRKSTRSAARPCSRGSLACESREVRVPDVACRDRGCSLSESSVLLVTTASVDANDHVSPEGRVNTFSLTQNDIRLRQVGYPGSAWAPTHGLPSF